MSKQLEVGDTFIIRGVVKTIENERLIKFDMPDGTEARALVTSVIEIIPGPYTPKVGDFVTHVKSPPGWTYKILSIDGNDIWCRVVSIGDSSFGIGGLRSYQKSDLTECVV